MDMNRILNLFTIFFFIIFPLNAFGINKNCQFPDIIDESLISSQSNSTILDIPNSKPRVYYNYPESNLGFVNEKLENTSNVDYNYKKVSTWIDTILSEMFSQEIEYSFFRGSDFDYQLSSHTYAEFKNYVNNPDWYSCKGNIECQKYKTGLSDLAFDIKNQKFTEGDNFNVIVTDLFIDEQEIGANNSSIQKLFESTFKENKSIGVYGIKSKFNGNMYNIPGTQVYDKATTRPFFIITIGSKTSVLKFKELIDRDALKDVKSKDKHFTIFTSDLILSPVNTLNIDKDLFDFNNSVREGIDDWSSNDEFIKYTLSRRDSDPININFNLSEIQLPNTILLQNLTIEPTIWKYKEKSNNVCWIEIKNNDLVDISQNNETISLSIFGKSKLKKIKPKEIYLINFKIFANDLGVTEQDFWMSDWNLDDSDINKVTTSGEQDFPVLNLLKIMRKLDDIQTDEFKRPNRPKSLPIEFNLAIGLDK